MKSSSQDQPCADAGSDIPRSPIERRVTRYACPYCGKSRSKCGTVAQHMWSCWRNPAARTCGTCDHEHPPERGEPADYYTGYPGSPSYPRSCGVGIDNAVAMPRACEGWLAARDMGSRVAAPVGQQPRDELNTSPRPLVGEG